MQLFIYLFEYEFIYFRCFHPPQLGLGMTGDQVALLWPVPRARRH